MARRKSSGRVALVTPLASIIHVGRAAVAKSCPKVTTKRTPRLRLKYMDPNGNLIVRDTVAVR